jgi:hypothetical protein
MGSIFRKGSEQTGQSSALSNQQAAMASELFGNTQGVRDRIFGGMSEFLGEGKMPSVLRSTVGLGVPIAQQEAEMSTARRGIVDSMPRGGLQQRALMELPLQRLLQRDMLAANRNAIDDKTRQNLFSMAAGISTGTPQTAMAGLDGAADNLFKLGGQRMAQNQSAQQGIGKALGSAATMGAGYAMPAMGPGSLGGQKKGATR